MLAAFTVSAAIQLALGIAFVVLSGNGDSGAKTVDGQNYS